MRSGILCFALFGGALISAMAQDVASVHIVEQSPITIQKIAPDVLLIDFGRVAFGNLLITPPPGQGPFSVHFGEALQHGRIETHPPGSVRYSEVSVDPHSSSPILVAPGPDRRNTSGNAVRTPAAWGVLTPFRWVELQGWHGDLSADQIRRRAAFDSTWIDNAASFHSSDPMLDKVWELSHYSIKATTFAGVFLDGDRERLSYEADAYLNQLGYYAGDADPRMPRATFERLMAFPTWPTEWSLSMVFIAHADWMQTGDKAWLAAHYESLKSKLLDGRVGPDGLITSSPAQMTKGDLVDWPTTERDGFVFTPVNTVVNAFRLRALQEMAELAEALGKKQEAETFRKQEQAAQAAFQQKLFDPAKGLYRDGVGTDHASAHANLFPLAFGLVPPQQKSYIARWLADRGMAVSVYAAQYLLEALFENGEDKAAQELITAPGDRSWRHMVESGTTITWEAWDQKYKPNQDWNHAWGAAPANILPRFVLGVQILTPGWASVSIQPHPGTLTHAEGRLPTPHGELAVNWKRERNFILTLALPPGTTAKVKLPASANAHEVAVNGVPVKAHHQGQWWVLDKEVSGSVTIEER